MSGSCSPSTSAAPSSPPRWSSRAGGSPRTSGSPTPQAPHADADGLWRTLLTRWSTRSPAASALAGVGVGLRRADDAGRAGEVSPLNIPGVAGASRCASGFSERFPGLPVRLHNDAVAWRSASTGAAPGAAAHGMLGMVVSTGVGGGLILGGRLVDGASGNAGHIGHVIVDPDGPACACGGRGCLEAIARGPGLVGLGAGAGLAAASAEDRQRELADDAARGHPVALAAMRRAGRALGVAIASATHLCDLEVVAIGGGPVPGGAAAVRPAGGGASARTPGWSSPGGVRVVPAALGQDAGLVGAAALVFARRPYWSRD